LVRTISVLYVDDESGFLEIGKDYLELTAEFAVTTAPSAKVALDRLKSNGIQAIVSDYQMPGMDGIAFLKKVRVTDKHIPFIMFTGKGREEIAIEAFENGADFYLQKGGALEPQFAELTLKIKAAVEHRRADAQVAILNRLYTVLSATNKAVVRIHDKKELLNEICRIVVDNGGFTMAWAGLVNGEKHLLEPVAASGHVEGYLDTISISIDDTPDRLDPTGTAFREGTFNVCNDIERGPKMAPWRKEALNRGYCSLAAFPFALDTRNAGVITFYASEPGFFNDQIIRLLDEQSGDISFALVTLEHEEQRKFAENERNKSELKYRRLFETAQDAILILDGDTGEIIDANKFILDMLGYPLDNFIGKHLWELGFLKDKSFAQNAFTKLKTDGYIRYEDLPLETKQGKSISVEFVSNAYFVGDKRIIQCNIRDITDRKVAHDILQVSENRYRRLFETAQDAILILDGDTGEIIDANTFILDMLGYHLDYFVGRHLWELGFLKDKSFAQNAFTKLKTDGYIRYEDLPLETKQGKSISVEFVSNVYLVGDKRIIQCNIRDVTERKRADNALALASKKLKLLSSVTRHDIINQLTILSGSLELSQKTVKEPEKIVHINRAQKAAATIQRQIAFTKEYENLGVRTPVWQRLSVITRLAASQMASNTITFEIPEDNLEIYADPLLIKVFYNLFDNARQHGESVTHISISHHPTGTGLIITVADNGIGISTEDKPHLFERGFGKNTGLGLFLSLEILSITGISICENGTPGNGAQFEITVPEGTYRSTEEPSS
jgi:PAS domain S-box-containing protein